jgi:hypothetical protein
MLAAAVVKLKSFGMKNILSKTANAVIKGFRKPLIAT